MKICFSPLAFCAFGVGYVGSSAGGGGCNSWFLLSDALQEILRSSVCWLAVWKAVTGRHFTVVCIYGRAIVRFFSLSS